MTSFMDESACGCTAIQVHFPSFFTRQYSFAMYTRCIHTVHKDGYTSTHAGAICYQLFQKAHLVCDQSPYEVLQSSFHDM